MVYQQCDFVAESADPYFSELERKRQGASFCACTSRLLHRQTQQSRLGNTNRGSRIARLNFIPCGVLTPPTQVRYFSHVQAAG